MIAKQNDLLMQIILVSATVSIFSIQQAGFLGLYIIFIAFILLFYLNTFRSDTTTSWTVLLDKTAQILFTIALLFFYIFFCIVRYKEAIVDNLMPASWYTFSYLIFIILLFHAYVIRRTLEGGQSTWNMLAMMLNVMLFTCVLLGYTSATYFKTDGFHV
jgi:hypothetical protein